MSVLRAQAVHHVCAVPPEVRKELHLLWKWSYRWPWANMWVLGITRSVLSALLTTEPSLSRPQPFVFLRIHPLVFILFFFQAYFMAWWAWNLLCRLVTILLQLPKRRHDTVLSMGPLDLTVRAFGLQCLAFHFVALKLTATALHGKKTAHKSYSPVPPPGFLPVWTPEFILCKFLGYGIIRRIKWQAFGTE